MSTALGDLTSPEAGAVARSGAVLAVPVGATEQHGPHLPLSTDTDIALALAERLAERVANVVVAPAVPYGASGEHEGFDGTISIGADAMHLLLVELVRSVWSVFERVLLISSHGGNDGSVRLAQRQLGSEGRDVRVFFATWQGDAHAGRVETSLMLALDPRRVRIGAAVAGATDPIERLLPRLRRDGVRAVSPTGVLGDPAGATAAEGDRLLGRAVADLQGLLEGWGWTP